MSGARFSSGMTGLHSAVDSLALLLRPQGPGKCHVLTGELAQFRLLCHIVDKGDGCKRRL